MRDSNEADLYAALERMLQKDEDGNFIARVMATYNDYLKSSKLYIMVWMASVMLSVTLTRVAKSAVTCSSTSLWLSVAGGIDREKLITAIKDSKNICSSNKVQSNPFYIEWHT